MQIQPPPPVLVADRFPALLDALLDLLHSLADDDWQRPVHDGAWTVKDLAQHLLGDEMNILSGKRDRYHERLGPIDSLAGLVALINRRNDQWVTATRRLSPRLICELLRVTGDQVNAFFPTLDPFAAGGPVNWAGPDPAPVWLDVAREFTERWHHQQHIRDAAGRPGCSEPYFLRPVLETFARALPETFRAVEADEGTVVRLTVTGPSGGVWSVARRAGAWLLAQGQPAEPAAAVVIDEGLAWRLFTRGLPPAAALPRAQLSGDMRLAARVLDTVAILA